MLKDRQYPFNNPFRKPDMSPVAAVTTHPRRYALLAGYCSANSRGWDSFIGFYDSLEDAVRATADWISPAKWFQIINIDSGSIVRESEEDVH